MDGSAVSIVEVRKRLAGAELSATASAADPLAQFRQWLEDARGAEALAPDAMTLATVGSDLRPSTREVLLAGCDERGLVWYTNYESRKGVELASHPWAALQFHWPELERMVRIEGPVERTSAAEGDAYFAKRPLDMRIGAWASPQSRPIDGPQVLVANATRYGARFLLNPPRPPHWGGFRLAPDRWQFWQGRRSRLHDRLRYTLDGTVWRRDRLAP